MNKPKPTYNYRLALSSDAIQVVEEVAIGYDMEEATSYNQSLTSAFSKVLNRHKERFTEPLKAVLLNTEYFN